MHPSRQRTSDKGGGSRGADKRGEGEGGVNRQLLNAIAARDAATLAQRRTLQHQLQQLLTGQYRTSRQNLLLTTAAAV